MMRERERDFFFSVAKSAYRSADKITINDGWPLTVNGRRMWTEEVLLVKEEAGIGIGPLRRLRAVHTTEKMICNLQYPSDNKVSLVNSNNPSLTMGGGKSKALGQTVGRDIWFLIGWVCTSKVSYYYVVVVS